MFNLALICDAAASAAPEVAAPAAAPADPATQVAEQPNVLMQFLPIFLILIVFMFFMSRGQKKQQMKRQEMLDRIAKGDEVLLASGIYGKVAEVSQEDLVVEIAGGVVIKVAKAGIANVVTEEEPKTK